MRKNEVRIADIHIIESVIVLVCKVKDLSTIKARIYEPKYRLAITLLYNRSELRM